MGRDPPMALCKAVDQFKVSIFEIIAPEWDQRDRVHDWRNHVPEVIRLIWDDLGLEARCTAFVMASEKANAEEWE